MKILKVLIFGGKMKNKTILNVSRIKIVSVWAKKISSSFSD